MQIGAHNLFVCVCEVRASTSVLNFSSCLNLVRRVREIPRETTVTALLEATSEQEGTLNDSEGVDDDGRIITQCAVESSDQSRSVLSVGSLELLSFGFVGRLVSDISMTS